MDSNYATSTPIYPDVVDLNKKVDCTERLRVPMPWEADFVPTRRLRSFPKWVREWKDTVPHNGRKEMARRRRVLAKAAAKKAKATDDRLASLGPGPSYHPMSDNDQDFRRRVGERAIAIIEELNS